MYKNPCSTFNQIGGIDGLVLDRILIKLFNDICRKYFHHNFNVSDINRHTKV